MPSIGMDIQDVRQLDPGIVFSNFEKQELIHSKGFGGDNFPGPEFWQCMEKKGIFRG